MRGGMSPLSQQQQPKQHSFMMGAGGMQGMHPQQLHSGGGGPRWSNLGGQLPHQQQHPHGNMSASQYVTGYPLQQPMNMRSAVFQFSNFPEQVNIIKEFYFYFD